MPTIPTELRDLVQTGPMAHVTKLNPDGSPQVTVVWVGLDGDDLVTRHLHHGAKLRNVERDPRAVISMDASRTPGEFFNPYNLPADWVPPPAVPNAGTPVEPDRAKYSNPYNPAQPPE